MNKIKFGAFYITNVCRKTCDRCATFNNFRLKGHLSYSASKEKLEAWNKQLDIEQITILGGEPLLHPEVTEWVKNIRILWKRCQDMRVVTGLNGKELERFKTLFYKWIEEAITIEISVHDPKEWDDTVKFVESITDQYVECVDSGDLNFSRKNYFINKHLAFSIMQNWNFLPNSIKIIKNKKIHMHNNNSKDSYDSCFWKNCHYFVDGDLYKCVTTALSKTLVTQLPIDKDSKIILEKVKGINPLTDTFLGFQNEIPQCKLCSINNDLKSIWPLKSKKIAL